MSNHAEEMDRHVRTYLFVFGSLIVGPYQGSKPREILGDPQEWLDRLRAEAAA